LTKAVRRPRESVHQSEYYLRLVQGVGIEGSPKGLRYMSDLAVTDTTRTRAARLLEQHGVTSDTVLVGFAPGAAYGHAKRWPPERVAHVIERLARERGVRAVLVGAGGDREAGRAIESSLSPGISVVNLIGRTDLRLLMGVMRACRSFVSNDSGAMHLAAALGVPVTAIFGPTNEKATAPLGDHDVILQPVFCRPCMLRECPIDHRCMKRISEDEVFGALTRRMDRHA
jgi:heptosyltransferase-2